MSNVLSAEIKHKIVFLGDSLTAGYQLSIEKAYPALLNKKLTPLNWQAINAGISGDTTAGGLARISWILKGKPDIVVIALGANDGMRGLSTWAMQRNLEKIVAQIQANGGTAVIVGMYLPGNYGKHYRDRFAKVYRNVSTRYFTTLIPFLLEGVALTPSLNLADGLHPNAKGHQEIANQLYPVLLPIIQKRERGEL